jgi:O-acetyl-ADP-ribose deacetylase (regulator of RNase III)
MIIQYSNKDLLSHHGAIAHGVNCQGVAKSGVAGAIRKQYPNAYTSYDHMCKFSRRYNNRSSILGNITTYQPIKGNITDIVHIFTQDYFGEDSERYVSYSALARGLGLLELRLMQHGITVVGIPKIGCGLGGGNWNFVKDIIDDSTPNIDVIIYENTQT